MTIPLCVDLDGTLIKTDTLQEALMVLLKRNPLTIFNVLFWLLHGRAYLKRKIAERVSLDPSALPYNQEFLAWIKAEKQAGRQLILISATDKNFADPVAEHLGIFDQVIASEGTINLRSKNKRDKLISLYGEGGYDYAGNDYPDIAVWQTAHKAIVVDAPARLVAKCKKMPNIGKVFLAKKNKIKLFLQAMRPHQFVKNFLLFIPLIAAHQIFNLHLLFLTLLGFIVFCLLAGATYIINDLLDLKADREHSIKNKRPFAAGDLTIANGFRFALFLFILVVLIALMLPRQFAIVLALYFILTLSYSFYFKRILLLDVCFLACLYTIRIIAGISLGQMFLSEWLLLFSIFLFLSLAFVKRYAELMLKSAQGKQQLPGRAYDVNHLSILSIFGIVSGYLAALVLALYLNSPAALVLYKTPQWLWGLVVLLIYWVSRIWLLAIDGKLHDDPVYFAIKDPISYLILVFAVCLGILANI